MLEVKIAGSREISESREVWDRMVRFSFLPSIFCTWDFITTWLDHFREDYEPMVLFIHEGGHIRGILPLALGKNGRGPFKKRVLTYCGSTELYSDHIDIISTEEHYARCMRAVTDFFLGEFRDWDLISLSHLTEGNRIMNYMQTGDIPFKNWTSQVSVSRYADLAAGSGSTHPDSKRKAKKLRLMGFEYLSGGPDVEEGVKTLFRLHALRAESRGIESTFAGRRLMDFHEDFARKCFLKDRLWLRFLEKKAPEKRIAAFYGFEFEGRLSYYQAGIDPEWDSHGPGTALIYLSMAEAASKGLAQYDFLRGDNEYKKRWAPNLRRLSRIIIFNKTVRARIARNYLGSRRVVKKLLKGTSNA